MVGATGFEPAFATLRRARPATPCADAPAPKEVVEVGSPARGSGPRQMQLIVHMRAFFGKCSTMESAISASAARRRLSVEVALGFARPIPCATFTLSRRR